MRKPRILKNKKGIVFADVIGAIQRTINWFFTTAPKPLLLLFFLIFIILFASIFGFVLNTTGHFCDTQGNLYKTGFLSIITNVELLTSMPSQKEIQEGVIRPSQTGFFDRTLPQCSPYLTGWTYEQDGIIRNLTPAHYFHDTGRCTQCKNITKTIPPEGGLFSEEYCSDNILLPKSHEDKSLWGKWFCGAFLGSCTIPEGYRYNRINNTFECTSPLCAATTTELWNLKLKETGAKIILQEEIARRDYRNAVSIECEPGRLDPEFKTFGIKIFDYKLWIILLLLTLLVWGVYKIKYP